MDLPKLLKQPWRRSPAPLEAWPPLPRQRCGSTTSPSPSGCTDWTSPSRLRLRPNLGHGRRRRAGTPDAGHSPTRRPARGWRHVRARRAPRPGHRHDVAGRGHRRRCAGRDAPPNPGAGDPAGSGWRRRGDAIGVRHRVDVHTGRPHSRHGRHRLRSAPGAGAARRWPRGTPARLPNSGCWPPACPTA